MSVTKDDSVQWHEVMTVVRNVIAEFYKMATKSPTKNLKHESPVEKIINREYTDVEQKFPDILTEYVSCCKAKRWWENLTLENMIRK